jgi:hypothetical protein
LYGLVYWLSKKSVLEKILRGNQKIGIITGWFVQRFALKSAELATHVMP